MTTLLKKLSAKNVVGNIVAPPIGVEKELLVLMGFVKSSEIKTTTFGDSTGFHGDFKAINVETGEEFRSGTCYLPDVASDLLANALAASNGAVVEFGFKVSIIGVKSKIDGEANKYEYRCKPLMEASENDPLAALEDRLKKIALAAPKAEGKPKAAK